MNNYGIWNSFNCKIQYYVSKGVLSFNYLMGVHIETMEVEVQV